EWDRDLEEDRKSGRDSASTKLKKLKGKRVGKWKALNRWADGAEFYDHETNKCNNTELCNKYKRIVQSNTTHVGCAHHQCENFPERKKNIVVCNYAPSSTEDRPYVDGEKDDAN
ncbi:GLIPR1-like protein, partial [Schistosoma japonicum]